MQKVTEVENWSDGLSPSDLKLKVNIHIFLRLHLVSPQQNIDERILKSGEVVVLILVKR